MKAVDWRQRGFVTHLGGFLVGAAKEGHVHARFIGLEERRDAVLDALLEVVDT